MVKPRPRHCQFAIRQLLRNLEWEGSVGVRASLWEIARERVYTAALEGMNDLPFGGLGGFLVSRDADLTATAAVGCGADKCQLLGGADGPFIHRIDGVRNAFAGEVGAILCERVFGLFAKRNGLLHDHVSSRMRW
ncbi:hypothetical protein IAQ61_005765 [Plenodomus lingam]|uniref:uncharacterized protein n=1 Tax=Leptosphaeria maculans TaxID=5022 RepID=UPI0033189E1C|nr:hypothetical protein IAQ61_005765 [Plenodomus lingam]